MSDVIRIKCWSCHEGMTLFEHEQADGMCPCCGLEVDLVDYLTTAIQENSTLKAEAKALREEVAALRKDKARLDAIEGNCWDVRYDSSPNADAGDSSISIEIIGHYEGKPHVRVLGENYSENLRAAIDQAMTAEAYPPARPEYDENGRPLRALLQR